MNGLACFMDGFSLIRKPGLRRYVLIPALINTLVMLVLVGLSYSKFNDWVAWIMSRFPDWMSALYWLVWSVAMIVVLLLIMYLFTLIANLIASPFNAVLSAKVEQSLTGHVPISTVSVWQLLPRAIAREVRKFFYLLPRLIGLLVITIIPVINAVAPFFWILFGAWMMSIQYADYAADNNDVSFDELRTNLGTRKFQAIMFGLPAYLLLTIPLVNLILMPVAVAGGTRLWVERRG